MLSSLRKHHIENDRDTLDIEQWVQKAEAFQCIPWFTTEHHLKEHLILSPQFSPDPELPSSFLFLSFSSVSAPELPLLLCLCPQAALALSLSLLLLCPSCPHPFSFSSGRSIPSHHACPPHRRGRELLCDAREITIEEQVAMFLVTLKHDQQNRCTQYDFQHL
ncbi:hypothetical protein EJ110_NYTH24142 [Nymphaea thermarum]|nr:hypothetical protein EJ110_NYTH24142 [Nymphaea thermarum]